MPWANTTNTKRVDAICGFLDLLKKSADSNRATPEAIHATLIPVLAKLGDLGIVAGPGDQMPHTAPVAPPAGWGTPTPPEAPVAPPALSEPVQRRKDRLQSMATTDLIDLMIAAGAVLQDRRS